MEAHIAAGGEVEVREADGANAPQLRGLALPFGRVAGDRPEVFAPGSVTASSPLRVEDGHFGQPLTYAAAEVREDGLHITAPLTPQARAALDAGKRRLSVEFRAKRSKWTQGVREIVEAVVDAVALVPSGAYDQARAEVRRQRGPRVWL